MQGEKVNIFSPSFSLLGAGMGFWDCRRIFESDDGSVRLVEGMSACSVNLVSTFFFSF